MFHLESARRVIQREHFTTHREATQVILETYKAWFMVKSLRFLDTDENKMVMPMTLSEYQDHQHFHFTTLRDKVSSLPFISAIFSLA